MTSQPPSPYKNGSSRAVDAPWAREVPVRVSATPRTSLVFGDESPRASENSGAAGRLVLEAGRASIQMTSSAPNTPNGR